MDNGEKQDIAHVVLRYVEQLMDAPSPPLIPEEYAEDGQFVNFHEKMLELRSVMASFAKGDLSPEIKLRGVMAGFCKEFQSNLRHMTWKVQQVEKGDYTQRMDFMGEFSSAFNSMVIQLAITIESLKQKEEALTNLAVSLQEEVQRRSITLEHLRKSEAKFKYLAEHDSLTGALNRRSFFSLAQTKLESSVALTYDCCVCLLDVDHFKVFNDTYGHIEGDRALKYIVEQSIANLRQSDIMGRYGGEEFIFFFANASAEQGKAAAERIRAAIEQTPFVLQNNHLTPLRASLGVAVIPVASAKKCESRELLNDAIARADAALYEAKRQGRNRVVMSSLNSMEDH